MYYFYDKIHFQNCTSRHHFFTRKAAQQQLEELQARPNVKVTAWACHLASPENLQPLFWWRWKKHMQRFWGGVMLVSFFLACCPKHFATLRWCKRAYKCCKPPKAHEGWVARESFGRNCVALLRLLWMRVWRWFTWSLFSDVHKFSDLFWKVSREKGTLPIFHLAPFAVAPLQACSRHHWLCRFEVSNSWANGQSLQTQGWQMLLYLWRVESGQKSRSEWIFSWYLEEWFFSTTRWFIYLATLPITNKKVTPWVP